MPGAAVVGLTVPVVAHALPCPYSLEISPPFIAKYSSKIPGQQQQQQELKYQDNNNKNKNKNNNLGPMAATAKSYSNTCPYPFPFSPFLRFILEELTKWQQHLQRLHLVFDGFCAF